MTLLKLSFSCFHQEKTVSKNILNTVSFDVGLTCPSITVKQEDGERKGFGFVADFVFCTGGEKTNIEMICGTGAYDDTKKYPEELKEAVNKLLERDSERLRRAGIKVDNLSF